MSEQDIKRWRFLLTGSVGIYPLVDDEGNTVCMVVETDMDVWECDTPSEVNDAIDMALYKYELGTSSSVH